MKARVAMAGLGATIVIGSVGFAGTVLAQPPGLNDNSTPFTTVTTTPTTTTSTTTPTSTTSTTTPTSTTSTTTTPTTVRTNVTGNHTLPFTPTGGSGGSSSLPFTGADIAELGGIAAVALGAGSFLLYRTRRREA